MALQYDEDCGRWNYTTDGHEQGLSSHIVLAGVKE